MKHSINWVQYLKQLKPAKPKQDVREIWKNKEPGQ